MCLRCADGHLFGTFVVLLVCAGNVPEGTCSALSSYRQLVSFWHVPGMCRSALVRHIRHLSACAGDVPYGRVSDFWASLLLEQRQGCCYHPLAAWGDARKHLVEVAVAGGHMRNSPTDWQHCPTPHAVDECIPFRNPVLDWFAHIIRIKKVIGRSIMQNLPVTSPADDTVGDHINFGVLVPQHFISWGPLLLLWRVNCEYVIVIVARTLLMRRRRHM